MNEYIDPKDEETACRFQWEKKVITMDDLLYLNLETDSMADVLAKHRDWMLGGKEGEWKYEKNKLNGDVILWRR